MPDQSRYRTPSCFSHNVAAEPGMHEIETYFQWRQKPLDGQKMSCCTLSGYFAAALLCGVPAKHETAVGRNRIVSVTMPGIFTEK